MSWTERHVNVMLRVKRYDAVSLEFMWKNMHKNTHYIEHHTRNVAKGCQRIMITWATKHSSIDLQNRDDISHIGPCRGLPWLEGSLVGVVRAEERADGNLQRCKSKYPGSQSKGDCRQSMQHKQKPEGVCRFYDAWSQSIGLNTAMLSVR